MLIMSNSPVYDDVLPAGATAHSEPLNHVHLHPVAAARTGSHAARVSDSTRFLG